MPGRAALHLHFSQALFWHDFGKRTGSRPVFLASNGIHGTVTVDYTDLTPASASTDIIKICLSGTVSIKIPRERAPVQNGVPMYSKFRKRILNMVNVIPLSTAHNTTSLASQVSVQFDLALSKALSYLTENHDELESRFMGCSDERIHLPSSLSVGSVLTSPPPACGQRIDSTVCYTLEASAIRDGEVIGSTSEEVHIFDSSEPQPPTCVSDFSSEYLCRQKRDLKKHIFTKIGCLFADIAEPKPFMFCGTKDLAYTKLPISFIVQRSHAESGKNARFSIEDLVATISWRLRTSTFISVEPMSSLPTLNQSIMAPYIILIADRGLRHQLKLNLHGWRRTITDHVFGSDHGLGEAWVKEDEFLLSIPKRVLLAPSFFTPHLSRRYSLQVQISVTGNGKANLLLEVPVQVVYQNEAVVTTSNLGRESHDSGGELSRYILDDANAVAGLPVYIR